MSFWAWRAGERWEDSRTPVEPTRPRRPQSSIDMAGRGGRLNFIYNIEKIYS